MQEVDLLKIVNNFEEEVSTLNEYFFYCLDNSLRARDRQLNISNLYSISPFLTERRDNEKPLIQSDFLKKFEFKVDGGVNLLIVDDINDFIPEEQSILIGGTHMVDYVLCNYLGEYAVRLLCKEESKPLKIILGSFYSSSSFFHLKTYSNIKTFTWLRNFVTLQVVQSNQIKIDLELEEFLMKAKEKGTLRSYNFLERLNVLKDNYPIGSICCLFERDYGKHLVDKTRIPIGSIVSQKIIKITGYFDEGFYYESYNCVNTKTELLRQYNQISEDKQVAFKDLKNPKLSISRGSCSVSNTGIDFYIDPFDVYFLQRFNTKEIVEKEILVDDVPTIVKMTSPEAVYFLLREYDVSFDEEKFKEDYNML